MDKSEKKFNNLEDSAIGKKSDANENYTTSKNSISEINRIVKIRGSLGEIDDGWTLFEIDEKNGKAVVFQAVEGHGFNNVKIVSLKELQELNKELNLGESKNDVAEVEDDTDKKSSVIEDVVKTDKNLSSISPDEQIESIIQNQEKKIRQYLQLEEQELASEIREKINEWSIADNVDYFNDKNQIREAISQIKKEKSRQKESGDAGMESKDWLDKELRLKKEAQKIVEKMPVEEREKTGFGLGNLDFFTQEGKSRNMAKICEFFAPKEGSVGRFFLAMAETYRKNEEGAKKRSGEGHIGELQNKSFLLGNIMKYGRIVADIVGWTAGSPLRYVMLGAQFFSRGAEAAKEARLKNQEVVEKTRVKDIDEAAEEAWKIYENAKSKSDGENVSKEILEKAYAENLPQDLLKRLKRSEPEMASGILSKIFQKILKKDVEFAIKHGKFSESSFSRRLNEFDKIIGHYGSVDALAMGARYAETTGKSVVAGVQIETAALLMQKLPEMMSKLPPIYEYAITSLGLKDVEQPVSAGKSPEKPLSSFVPEAEKKTPEINETIDGKVPETKTPSPAEDQSKTKTDPLAENQSKTPALAEKEKNELEILTIGARGPEGEIIDYFRENPDIAVEKFGCPEELYGPNGEITDLDKFNEWAGKKAHQLWLEDAKEAMKKPETLEQLKKLGYSQNNQGYAEMMKRIGKGNIEIDLREGKIKLVDNEYLKKQNFDDGLNQLGDKQSAEKYEGSFEGPQDQNKKYEYSLEGSQNQNAIQNDQFINNQQGDSAVTEVFQPEKSQGVSPEGSQNQNAIQNDQFINNQQWGSAVTEVFQPEKSQGVSFNEIKNLLEKSYKIDASKSPWLTENFLKTNKVENIFENNFLNKSNSGVPEAQSSGTETGRELEIKEKEKFRKLIGEIILKIPNPEARSSIFKMSVYDLLSHFKR